MDKALAIQKEVQRILGTDEVYLVGGSVRDLVMNNEPKDYDFTTPMLPEDIVEKVKAVGRRVYTIGEKFGTIGFKVKALKDNVERVEGGYIEHLDDLQREVTQEHIDNKIVNEDSLFKYEYVEVTTFRSEVYTNKSRKPEVKFVPSLDEDLARRDFTFNAMVLRSDGSIYDPYGGKLDIYAKQIKTVGMPKDRIQEDPLRMLRAARFAARYSFKIDPNFIGKARQLADRIYDVSVERWVQELDKLLTSNDPYWGTRALHNMGLLERILPEIYTDDKHDSRRGDMKIYDNADEAWKFLLSYTERNPKTAHYVAGGICHRLKFSNDRTDIVLDKPKREQVQ